MELRIQGSRNLLTKVLCGPVEPSGSIFYCNVGGMSRFFSWEPMDVFRHYVVRVGAVHHINDLMSIVLFSKSHGGKEGPSYRRLALSASITLCLADFRFSFMIGRDSFCPVCSAIKA